MLVNILTDTSVYSIILSMGVALILGLIIAITHKVTSKYSKNFLTTITILPLLVAMVILVVNGNLGMGVAVAGAFGLVRFRSIAGTSKEILSIFFAMAIGLAIGAGYPILATVVTIIGSLGIIILEKTSIFDGNKNEKYLKITIPENIDYTEVFNDILDKYTCKYKLEQVKTTNLGSMFELKYLITLNSDINEKAFIDELRVKNGNLKISLTKYSEGEEL